MKSVILYRTPKTTGHYQSIDCGDGHEIFVRTEVVDKGIDEALDAAKPREGETVINTLPLE